MKLCPAQQKRCYSSKAQARMANRRNGHRLKVYHCPDCGFWHVTKRGAW